MVRTELDGPPDDIVVTCKICGQPLRARYHWVYDRWLRGTVHEKCVPLIDKQFSKDLVTDRKIPERFREYKPELVTDQKALAKAQAFGPTSKHHTLAILGPPGKGKSRLGWAICSQYFDELYESTGARRWCDYFGWEETMADFDRSVLTRIKQSQFAFLDDLGATDSFGRARADMQIAVRSRIKANRWSILSVDDMSFDPELENIIKDRALVVVID